MCASPSHRANSDNPIPRFGQIAPNLVVKKNHPPAEMSSAKATALDFEPKEWDRHTQTARKFLDGPAKLGGGFVLLHNYTFYEQHLPAEKQRKGGWSST
jgi:hypothetical protein